MRDIDQKQDSPRKAMSDELEQIPEDQSIEVPTSDETRSPVARLVDLFLSLPYAILINI
jgi:hypothetical protein